MKRFNENEGVIVNSDAELNVLTEYLDSQGYKWNEKNDFKLSSLEINKGVFFEGYPLAVFPDDGKWIPNINKGDRDDLRYIQFKELMYFSPEFGDRIDWYNGEEWVEAVYIAFEEDSNLFHIHHEELHNVFTLGYNIRPRINIAPTVTEDESIEEKFKALIDEYTRRRDFTQRNTHN